MKKNNLNINSLTKSFKSLKFVKMINNGLLTLAKVLKIQPKIMYVILGLLAVILVALGLGLGIKREGLETSPRRQLSDNNKKRNDVVNNIINFISAMSTKQPSWDSSLTFLDNLDTYFKTYNSFNIQNYLKSKDVNADGKVMVDKSSNKFIRDNVGEVVNSDEKLYYNDVNAQDINKDGKIVAYRNSDSGNFYRDNNGSEVFPSSSPYILQVLPSATALKTQAMVDAALLPVTAQINTLTSADDKKTINDLIKDYIDYTDKIIKIENDNATYSQLYNYNPDDISIFDTSFGGDTSTAAATTAASAAAAATTAAASAAAAATTAAAEAAAKAEAAKTTPSAAATAAAASAAAAATTAAAAAAAAAAKAEAAKIEAAKVEAAKVAAAAAKVESDRVAAAKVAAAKVEAAKVAAAATTGVKNVPAGSKDLYMLKTQIIPPGCPVGGCSTGMSSSGIMSPASVDSGPASGPASDPASDFDSAFSPGSASGNCSRQAPIPPCPPCERCPEPAFDCKRVPNYNSAAVSQYLPRPVLADFSQFGM